MARIRSIKPTIWESEQYASVTRDQRLLFVGLITQADDEGRLRGNPALIRGKVFPYDDDLTNRDIDHWLEALADAGLIRRYTTENQQYIDLPTFNSHQQINRASTSRLPAYETRDMQAEKAPSVKTHGTLSEPSPPEGIKEGKRKGTPLPPAGGFVATDKRTPTAEDIEVFETWKQLTKHPRAILTDDRLKVIQDARTKYKATQDEILAAIRGIAADDWPGRKIKFRDDLSYALKDRKTIDGWIEEANKPEAQPDYTNPEDIAHHPAPFNHDAVEAFKARMAIVAAQVESART